ncbi:phosphatase PAP2 family protein [Mucilaginibacter sp.]|uniref:phosphatase PAP2 family protein n=1 Tax=Mucilaginibacter sp. TaxID=1882438 RepID=UPI002612C944|nr:phosphatase PAP2 family protein [Mucilaginibacter sp.]
MNIGINDVLKQIRLFFIIYLILLCACLTVKVMFTKEVIYFAVNSKNYSFGDEIAPYITDIGNGWTIIILSALLVLYNYRTAFLMITSYAITSILAQVAKFIFDAPRPILLYKDKLNLIHLVKGVDMLQYHSFPSGHTVTAFSAAVVIAYLTKNKKWSILLLIIAAAVGYSRMYLSEHFFEDVTVGSVIGVVITVCWISYIDNKQFLHTPKWNKGLLKKS